MARQDTFPMRAAPATLFAVALLAAAAGCRSNTHLVERELREREADVRELKEELSRTDTYNRTLQLELRATRGDLYGPGGPDGPIALYPIRTLTLGRQTGGRELEGTTGDAALQVVLEPRDADNQSIKVPGAAVIQLFEITPEGMKHFLSAWEITPDELSRTWKAGLLTTGYVLVLPWKELPTSEKLRVVAQFRLSDGRVFEAEKDVTIRMPKGLPIRPMPPAKNGDAPDGPVLPPPRKVEPAESNGREVSRKPWWETQPTRLTPRPAAIIGRPQPAEIIGRPQPVDR
jgi:hypothetical protein